MPGGIKDQIIELQENEDLSFEEAEEEAINRNAMKGDALLDAVKEGIVSDPTK